MVAGAGDARERLPDQRSVSKQPLLSTIRRALVDVVAAVPLIGALRQPVDGAWWWADGRGLACSQSVSGVDRAYLGRANSPMGRWIASGLEPPRSLRDGRAVAEIPDVGGGADRSAGDEGQRRDRTPDAKSGLQASPVRSNQRVATPTPGISVAKSRAKSMAVDPPQPCARTLAYPPADAMCERATAHGGAAEHRPPWGMSSIALVNNGDCPPAPARGLRCAEGVQPSRGWQVTVGRVHRRPVDVIELSNDTGRVYCSSETADLATASPPNGATGRALLHADAVLAEAATVCRDNSSLPQRRSVTRRSKSPRYQRAPHPRASYPIWPIRFGPCRRPRGVPSEDRSAR